VGGRSSQGFSGCLPVVGLDGGERCLEVGLDEDGCFTVNSTYVFLESIFRRTRSLVIMSCGCLTIFGRVRHPRR
jgi:hypothetical protein